MNESELRDLDREMAGIMDWAWDEETQGWLFNKPDGKVGSLPDAEWRPTEDIRQAMMVADRLWQLGWWLSVSVGRDGSGQKWIGCALWQPGVRAAAASADHPEVAICLAAKAATEGER